MRHVMTLYEDEPRLETFLLENAIVDSNRLLIQVFTSENDKTHISALLEVFKKRFSQAVLVGTTTDGEIINGSVVTHETVLSFTQFEDTALVCAVSEEEESNARGRVLAQKLVDDETRFLLLFSDGLSTNGELFLEGVNATAPSMMVAGGLAGDYAKFETTYVFTKKKIVSCGAVGVAFRGKKLRIFNDYCFNWQKIGKALTITRCEGNRVYEIDGRSAVETYTHYLGQEITDLLPSIGIEFPLISSRNGMDVARAVLAKHEDNSLSFAGNMIEGESLYLGYGNMKKILQDSHKIPQAAAVFQAEAIFVYSCMARRNFIGNAISQELEPLQDVAPTSGFFTYGEFFYHQKNELMNQTMTVVALSESPVTEKEKIPSFSIPDSSYHSINALIHLLNVTGQEVMEQRVFAKSYERFAQLFEHSGDGLVVIRSRQIVECNEKTLSLFGYASTDKNAFLKKPLSALILSVDEIDRKIEQMKKNCSSSLLFHIECRAKEGNVFWAEVMLTQVNSDAESYHYMVIRDISERKAMEEMLKQQHDQLYYKAYRDDLTGLPNRKMIMETLEQEMRHAMERDEGGALLFIDLDKLKVINDSLGHIAGDKLIQLVAKRFKHVLSDDTPVARLGGDEFLVLLKKSDKEAVVPIVEKLLRVTREEIIFEKNHLFISASIGVAQFPNDASDAYNLLKHADAAMYEAKERGGNQYYFYNEALTQKAYAQIKIAKEFRRGIKQKEFVVYYQPQVEMETGRLTGMEALVRWNHPEEGFLAPGKFLSAIEKANLLQRLDRWVMNQAMKEFVQWYQEGLNPGKLSLNIRMSELESSVWESKLIKTMKRIGFQPHWLEIEITETEIMKQPERVVTLIQDLHQYGITVAIDDFGTGYSSLAQLKYLPFDKLKIDKVFIDDLPENSDACILFDMMMTLANNLKVPVLAEGMETEEQVSYIRQTGCQYAQGYHYARPVHAGTIRKMLAENSIDALHM